MINVMNSEMDEEENYDTIQLDRNSEMKQFTELYIWGKNEMG